MEDENYWQFLAEASEGLFDAWQVEPFTLRNSPGCNYLPQSIPRGFENNPSAKHFLARAHAAFGNPNLWDQERLKDHLSAAHEAIENAVELSRLDSHVAWLRHEVWLPALDERVNGSETPAQLLIDSIGYAGLPDSLHAHRVCAAVAIWYLNESAHYFDTDNRSLADWALLQAATLMAEAEWQRGLLESDLIAEREWRRGFNDGEAETRRRASEVAKRAAEKSHAGNRDNKRRGLEIWQTREWRVQADAEREIAKSCNVVQAVAGRWIREFKHAASTNPAAQSKDSAPRDP